MIHSPSAINIAAVSSVKSRLIPELRMLNDSLNKKSNEFEKIIKLGRTHLQDATPLSLGQEFSGYATAINNGIKRLENALDYCFELAVGGTAVGTGINSIEGFGEAVSNEVSKITKLPFRSAPNKFEALGGQDSIVELSGALKVVSVSLLKLLMIFVGFQVVQDQELVK